MKPARLTAVLALVLVLLCPPAALPQIITTQPQLLGIGDSPQFAAVKLTNLTASKPVFTDASQVLTSSGTMPVNQGGTGLVTYAVGDLLAADSTTSLARLAAVASGQVMASAGTGTLPTWTASPAVTTLIATNLQAASGAGQTGVYFNGGVGSVTGIALSGTTQNSTSGTPNTAKVNATFNPTSGSASYTALAIRPTINATSTGTARAFAIASLTNVMSGGTLFLADFGVTTTDEFTGFTSKWNLDISGNTIQAGRATVANVTMAGGSTAVQLRSSQTTAPTCSSNCGTSPSVSGTDTFMTITLGTAPPAASTFTITFNGTWATAPSCHGTRGTTGTSPALIGIVTTTTTGVVNLGANMVASEKYHIACGGIS